MIFALPWDPVPYESVFLFHLVPDSCAGVQCPRGVKCVNGKCDCPTTCPRGKEVEIREDVVEEKKKGQYRDHVRLSMCNLADLIILADRRKSGACVDIFIACDLINYIRVR